MPEGVWIALITGGLGVLGTWLTVKYKDHKAEKPAKPKDRIETIFDGYEKLIREQEKAIVAKERQLEQSQGLLDQLQEELNRTREIVTMQQEEIQETREYNRALKQELASLKKQFSV